MDPATRVKNVLTDSSSILSDSFEDADRRAGVTEDRGVVVLQETSLTSQTKKRQVHQSSTQ
jgi:hypothetical protein